MVWKSILGILSLILIFMIGAKIRADNHYGSVVKKIEKNNPSLKGTYTTEKLKNLPAPVKRYFRYALAENQPLIQQVNFRHGGDFRTHPDGKWLEVEGREVITLGEPAFIWEGKISQLRAWDVYSEGKGSLKVNFLNLVSIINASGKAYDEGELARWVSELPLAPTALLPSKNLRWESIDGSRAKIHFTHKGMSVEGIFTFSENGEITSFETMRYQTPEQKSHWLILYKNWKNMNGITVPTEIQASWNPEKEKFSYANFLIDGIRHKTSDQTD